MKLRTRLGLSFALVAVFITAAALTITEFGIDDLTLQNIRTSLRGIKQITAANYDLSRSVLTRYGERIVTLQAREAAGELALLLRGRPSYDYAGLRRDEKLRKIATQPIYAEYPEKIKAGYIDLGDNSGYSVLHPNPEVEGHNFSEWKEQFPRMWKMVERAFTEEEVAGYYSFLDTNQRPQKKFMVTRRVQGTPFIVYASVYIDKFFLPVHRAIREAGRETIDNTESRIQASSEAFSAKIKKESIILGLFVLLLVGGLAWWFAARLARPIRRLRDGVRRLGKGDFSVEVPAGGSAETVELTEAFNQLGAQLKKYIKNLEKEVSAREAVESEAGKSLLQVSGDFTRWAVEVEVAPCLAQATPRTALKRVRVSV